MAEVAVLVPQESKVPMQLYAIIFAENLARIPEAVLNKLPRTLIDITEILQSPEHGILALIRTVARGQDMQADIDAMIDRLKVAGYQPNYQSKDARELAEYIGRLRKNAVFRTLPHR
jgi:hypothetical protein